MRCEVSRGLDDVWCVIRVESIYELLPSVAVGAAGAAGAVAAGAAGAVSVGAPDSSIVVKAVMMYRLGSVGVHHHVLGILCLLQIERRKVRPPRLYENSGSEAYRPVIAAFFLAFLFVVSLLGGSLHKLG